MFISKYFTTTDIWILIYCASLALCSIIFIIQILGLFYNSSRLRAEGRESYTSRRNSVWRVLIPLFTTYILSIAGISSTLHRLHGATQSLCDYTYSLTFMIYASIKIANYFFFLQRAKLAQGMNPIFKDKAFDKIIPCILFLNWILYMVCINFFPPKGRAVESEQTGRELCIWDDQIAFGDTEYYGIMLQTGLDLVWTCFFLYLFGKPMLMVHRATLKGKKGANKTLDMNDRKLQRTIVINFVFSTICSIHTAISAVTFPLGGIFYWWPILDFMVSSLCLFLMLASNRRFLVHMLCCSDKIASKCVKPPTFLNAQEIEEKQKRTSTIPAHLPGFDPNKLSPNTPPRKQTSNSDIYHNNYKPRLGNVPSNVSTTGTTRDSSPPPVPPPGNIVLSVSDNVSEPQEKEITCCKHLCCGGQKSSSITTKEWMGYLDGNCCYYKAKLLWTWLYYNFCCCHCYVMTLYLIPDGRLNGPRVKRRQKTMKRLFLAADKLLTLKYYVGVDTESSVKSSHTPQPSSNQASGNNHHDMKPIEEINEDIDEQGMYLPSMEIMDINSNNHDDHNDLSIPDNNINNNNDYHQKRNSTRL